jgi:DNA polymerase-1
LLEESGIDPAQVMFMSAMKCRVWDMDPNKTDQKACKPYLHAELDFVKPEYVLMMGNEALFAVAGRSGIMKYRGKVFTNWTSDESHTYKAMATISTGMIGRNPGYRDGLVADLRYFNSLITGVSVTKDPYHVPGDARRTYVGTKDALRSLLSAIQRSTVVSYDVETNGGSEYVPGAAVVSIALTLADERGMESATVWEVPLFHPESPWRRMWQRVLTLITKALCRVRFRIAHNAKFDTKWMQHHTGVSEFLPTFDTIIAMALLNENAPKGLKPNAQQILGADPWGIDTADLLNTPLAEVLEYNGLDTWHTLRLYYHFRALLKAQPRILKLFVHLMMPLVQELCYTEQRGVYVDQEVLATNAHIAQTMLEAIEDGLETFLPDTLPEQFVTKRGVEQINFGPSNFARWFLFDYLGLPVLARGKEKDDGSPGMPSMAEAIMLELAEMHPVGKLMNERALWYKRVTGFFNPYREMVDHNSRIHTTFKPWGTVTGRLSSGKEDAEKVTQRGDRRGVNLQQVPRDKLLRGVFGAPPGSSFVEADYSQVELRVAAFLARETTMLQLYATGQDIHMAMAMRMTGKPASQVTKEERKAAKAVNFGFLYGMGWRKFISTAWANYQVRVTEEEAQAFRVTFFEQFPLLLPWHRKQRRLAHTNKRVETPMGRVRHLPDIDSPDDGVRSEAERQAINSPVQAFASDMAALSLVHIARKFRKLGLTAHPIGTVHDAVNFEIPDSELRVALPVIKDTMENLPLERLFGINLDVPIVADLKVGTHWGGATELTPEQVYDWKGLVAA